MSGIGKLASVGEKGVKGRVEDGRIKLEGPKGKLETKVHPGMTVEISDGRIVVKRPGDSQEERSLHGLTRKLVANMAEGVGKGFTKVLEINGVGYRAEARASQINMTLGYSHPIVYQLQPGVNAKVDREGTLTPERGDQQLRRSVATDDRALKQPE